MQLRIAQKDDLLGIIDCLEVLSDVTFEKWSDVERSFDDREAAGNIITFVVVTDSLVMGTASLFIQRKLSHGGSGVALIEDVAVRQDCQGLGIGKWLVESCIDYARNVDCYKIVLNCGTHNIEFYEKFGFKTNGQVEMRLDL